MPLLRLSQILIKRHCFEPLGILSDFEDKSKYYFPNLDVSGRLWVREQFCRQLEFFDLQIAKKLQLIDSAACRLQFKLAEMNLIDFCTTRKKNYMYTLLDVKAVVLQPIFCVT